MFGTPRKIGVSGRPSRVVDLLERGDRRPSFVTSPANREARPPQENALDQPRFATMIQIQGELRCAVSANLQAGGTS